MRHLYLVHESDRFKVIALVDVDSAALGKLPANQQPGFFKSPHTVGLREASKEGRQKVMFECVQGGSDFGQRPSFYAPYDVAQAAKAYAKAKSMADFIKKHPSKQAEIDKLQVAAGQEPLGYLPIIARQDWVAVLNPRGEMVGYIKGDGF